jgi:hypothetical protein
MWSNLDMYLFLIHKLKLHLRDTECNNTEIYCSFPSWCTFTLDYAMFLRYNRNLQAYYMLSDFWGWLIITWLKYMYLSNNHSQHTKSLREHCSILALSIKKLFLKNKFLVKVDQPQSKENGTVTWNSGGIS